MYKYTYNIYIYICTVSGLIMAHFAEIYILQKWTCSLGILDELLHFFLEILIHTAKHLS
jgi:hypothetical protein